MGGKGSGRPTREQAIANNLIRGQQPISTNVNPGIGDMFIPNHSGIADHPEFILNTYWTGDGTEISPRTSGVQINIEDSKMGHFTGGTVGYLYFNGANGNIELTNTNSVGGDIILTPKDSNNIVDITTHKITNVVDPTNAQDGATKNYIDTKDVESFSTSLTAGSVVFSDGSNLSEDNSNFFYDQANTRIGIRETSPDSTFEIVGSSDATEDVYKAKAGANTLHTFQTVFHITDKNDLTVVKAEVRGSDQAGTFYLPAIRTIPSRDAQGLGITTSTGTAQHIIVKGVMCETGYAASYSPALLTGYVYGGKDSGDDLYLMSTNHATKGYVIIAPGGGNVGINNLSPGEQLDVTGNIAVSGTVDGVDVATLSTNYTNHAADSSDPHGSTLTQTDLVCTRDAQGFYDAFNISNFKLSADGYIAGASGTRGFVALYDGSIRGLGASGNCTIAGIGASFDIEIRVNGANVLQVNLDCATTGDKSASITQARDTDVFSAGDILSFYADENGTAALTLADAHVRIQYDA